jgi:hypothetical protein
MEGIPVALMEAMATRVPVVATRLSGIPELVEDEVSGRLVPHGDAQALADAIFQLHESESQRRMMGERGREKVLAEFGLQDNVAKLRALFQSATESEADVSRRLDSDASAPGANISSELGKRIAERAAHFFPGDGTGGNHSQISFITARRRSRLGGLRVGVGERRRSRTRSDTQAASSRKGAA